MVTQGSVQYEVLMESYHIKITQHGNLMGHDTQKLLCLYCFTSQQHVIVVCCLLVIGWLMSQ